MEKDNLIILEKITKNLLEGLGAERVILKNKQYI